jgi:uncharacterized repeat protein (TIGR04076 family)
MAPPAPKTVAEAADDTFSLYDLRVEVICPPGKRIMCGAKPGDHFTLEGEMLRLPEGQGFSIYSLGVYFSSLSFALAGIPSRCDLLLYHVRDQSYSICLRR